MGAELAHHGIRANTLASRIIRTPFIGEGADEMAGWHPLGRVGEVSDTSDAVLYVAGASFTGPTDAITRAFSIEFPSRAVSAASPTRAT